MIEILAASYRKVYKSLQLKKQHLMKIDTYDGLKKILEYKDWTNLKKLDINRCNLNFVDIKEISVTQLQGLKILVLSQNFIGVKGVKWLVKAELPDLQQLWMNQCQLDHRCCKILSKSQWKRLKYLNIRYNIFGISVPQALSEANWNQLSIIESNTRHSQYSFIISIQDYVCMESDNIKVWIPIMNVLQPVFKKILQDRFINN